MAPSSVKEHTPTPVRACFAVYEPSELHFFQFVVDIFFFHFHERALPLLLQRAFYVATILRREEGGSLAFLFGLSCRPLLFAFLFFVWLLKWFSSLVSYKNDGGHIGHS